MRVLIVLICLMFSFPGVAQDAPKEPSPFAQCKVLVNQEEQYSIWPQDRENPEGWRDAGFRGTHQQCLDYIDRVWTDMRPLSQRKSPEDPPR